MHQPYYKDPLTGVYRLPWVRLHGIKDYYDMVAILDGFPSIHQTFNIVPSLIEQLLDYTNGRAIDRFLDTSKAPAADLTEEQRLFVLSDFFLANWDNMIKPLPRYYELLNKRGKTVTKEDIKKSIKYFSDQDILDLQVLFNLSWFDPLLREKYPYLKELINKGRDYTEADKGIVIKTQTEALKLIIPEYKRMAEKGQIEISTTPFYHPILPLLYNTDLARIAMPHVRLPQYTFSHPEDAAEQVRMAVEYFEKVFGFKPKGMWPSEGSVGQDILNIIRQEGIRWIASDEGILSASLNAHFRDSSGAVREHERFYKPYLVGDDISMIFRDHTLSDLIGFVYHRWDIKRAVDDFIDRLWRIKSNLPGGKASLVPVILDGENVWEYYQNDGRDFLLHLYERLSREEWIKCVTVSEFLNEHPPEERIGKLFTGSWINSNFGIWIGHEEDNLAWDMLYEARDALSAYQRMNPQADLKDAWRAIYIAEGSDWCWWYGDEHVTETQDVFDELFRANLIKVYKVIGKNIPPRLLLPIPREDRKISPAVTIKGFTTPKIDGEVTNYYEWLNSAYIDTARSGGTMHMAEAFVSRVYYGFDLNNLFIRVDTKRPLTEVSKAVTYSIQFFKPMQYKLDVTIDGETSALFYRSVEKEWQFVRDIEGVAINDILETGLPFNLLGANEGDEVSFFISVLRYDEEAKTYSELERWPWKGFISIEVPGPGFEAMMWQ
ncbi:MAG: glycoside hydrolase [Nitrospirae bacterium]|nr:glycoside hydrolase [Nitrospirota bacterium]